MQYQKEKPTSLQLKGWGCDMKFKIDWVADSDKWTASIGKYMKWEGTSLTYPSDKDNLECLFNTQATLILKGDGDKKLRTVKVNGYPVPIETVRLDLEACLL